MNGHNDRGASFVEYALIVALVALVLTFAIAAFEVGAKKAYLSHCTGNQAPNGVCTLK